MVHLLPYHQLCSIYVTYGKLCHAIYNQVLPTQLLPRDVADFPRGEKHPKDVRLPICLDFSQPLESTVMDWCLSMSK